VAVITAACRYDIKIHSLHIPILSSGRQPSSVYILFAWRERERYRSVINYLKFQTRGNSRFRIFGEKSTIHSQLDVRYSTGSLRAVIFYCKYLFGVISFTDKWRISLWISRQHRNKASSIMRKIYVWIVSKSESNPAESRRASKRDSFHQKYFLRVLAKKLLSCKIRFDSRNSGVD